MQPQQFLKILVIVLGLAIVVALGFVIYGVARLGVQTAHAPVGAPKLSNLGQPEGSTITALTNLGDSRLAVAVSGGGLPDRIVVLDLGTGQVVITSSVGR
jgi:flagellar biogenesis protein FliO